MFRFTVLPTILVGLTRTNCDGRTRLIRARCGARFSRLHWKRVRARRSLGNWGKRQLPATSRYGQRSILEDARKGSRRHPSIRTRQGFRFASRPFFFCCDDLPRASLTFDPRSLGVDTFIDDPLTQFNITREAYPEMGKMIAKLGKETVFCLEGCVDPPRNDGGELTLTRRMLL